MYFKPISMRDASSLATIFPVSSSDLIPGAIRLQNLIVDQPIYIRLADSDQQRNAATVLLNRMYSWRGYGAHHQIAQSPSHTTFTASSDTETLGTITLVIDSPNGLGVDTLFKDIVDEHRARPGASVCELTRFAFDTAQPSTPTLASLFHLIFIYGSREYGCTDLFIEVNPRHVRFYERMLGFRALGAEKQNSLVAAPAQLMWLSIAHIRQQIDRHSQTTRGKRTYSLYTHFFSSQEEEGLYARMVASRTATATPLVTRNGALLRLLFAVRSRMGPIQIARQAGLRKTGRKLRIGTARRFN